MKYCKYILMTVAGFIMITSCKKSFLDVPNKNAIVRQAYVVDLKTTGEFLSGMYISLASVIGSTGLNYSELVADNIRPVQASTQTLSNCYRWNQLANDQRPSGGVFPRGQNANGFWWSGILLAQGCSFVIESADKYKSENPQLADNLKGQAYTIRALIHSMMVNIFAQTYVFTVDASHHGIPYTATSDWSVPAVRLSVAQVYNKMIADLNTAIPMLPDVQSAPSGFTHSLINKAGAKALLARLYLFKGDWMTAKNLAREVATAVPIMTDPASYPSKLFTNEETEAIFQLPPARPNVPEGAGSHSTTATGVYYAAPLHDFIATNDIAIILQENPTDLRRVWLTSSGSNWNITKYPKDVIPGFSRPTASYFQTLLRSSEMYLTAAESYAKLNMEDSARFYLNAIRQRATLDPLTSTTGTALADSIYKERRRELAFEGLRMYDIQRWKQNVNRMDAISPSVAFLPFGSNKAIAPIPVSDVQQLGMPQNPGY